MSDCRPSEPSSARSWCLAPGVWWAVETDGLLVGRGDASCPRRIPYPEAAVWDLLSRRHSVEETVSMLESIAALSELRARQVVSGAVRTWVDAGLLVEEERIDG